MSRRGRAGLWAASRVGRLRQVLGDRRTLALLAALGLVAAVRLLPLPAVFQEGAVVLTGNDPYFYRYWVERLASGPETVWDLEILASLPPEVATGEPLMVATLWWLSEWAGGSPAAVGLLLAIYPVVSAIITAGVVYAIAYRLAGDVRVGLAAVALLAVTPGHAFRTGLGFADHHAFDYPWLALTVLAVVVLATREGFDRRGWAVSAGLGVAFAGQALAWEASPLLLAPLGFAVAALGVVAVRREGTPVASLGPIVVGVGFGALLVAAAHGLLGWHDPAVVLAAWAVALVALGVLVAVAGARRTPAPPLALAGLYAVGGLAAVAAWWWVLPAVDPGLTAEFQSGLMRLFGLPETGIGEATPLISTYGPLAGPLIMLGYAVFLGLPVTAWAVLRAYRRNDPGWLLVSVYVWYFLGLTLIQRRFTGELAPVLAVVAGFGFVVGASWLELVRPVLPIEDRRAGIGRDRLHLPGRRRLLMLGGLGFVFGSFPTVFTAAIHRDLAIEPAAVRAALWMREYADERGWEYPRNYVLSPWGRNRVYNYFVSGESRSYSFARNNFGAFLAADPADADEWYERLRDRVGFVVLEAFDGFARSSLYDALYNDLGTVDGARGDALAHYRAVYASRDGTLLVFTLVEGARIVGEAPPETSITVSHRVSIPGGEFEYVRMATADADGRYEIAVPYPGEYAVGAGTATVPESAVVEDETIDGPEIHGGG